MDDAFVAPRNLDLWLNDIYQAHRDGGTSAFLVKGVVRLVVLGFTATASTLVVGFVDWGALRRDCAEARCDPGLRSPRGLGAVLLAAYVLGCAAYLGWRAASLVRRHRRMARVRTFFRRYLPDVALGDDAWAVVAEALVALQRDEGLCLQCNTATFTTQHVAMRVLRRQNYVTALVESDALDVGYLTPYVEWHLWFVVTTSMFAASAPQRVRLEASLVRREARRWCALGVVAMPFTLLFVAAHLLLRAAELATMREKKSSFRAWTNEAQWRLREYNEYRHVLDERLERAAAHHQRLVDGAAAPRLDAVARGAQFVCGSLAGCAAAIAALDDDASTHLHVADRSLLWWLACWTALYAAARAVGGNRKLSTPPERQRDEELLRAHARYLPDDHAYRPLLVVLWWRALVSVATMPWRLWRWGEQADLLVAFLERVTVVDGPVGDVCARSRWTEGQAVESGTSKTSRSQRSFVGGGGGAVLGRSADFFE